MVVRRLHRSIVPVLAALAGAGALAGSAAQASDERPPVAQTLAPTALAGVIVLHGTVDAGHQKTTYWFEVGPTTAYGSATQPAKVDKVEFPRFRGHLTAGPSGPAARIDVHAVYPAVFA